MCYTISVKGDGVDEPSKATQEISRKKFQKKMKFSLDKSLQMCYNKSVKRTDLLRNKKLGRDLPREMEIDTMTTTKTTNRSALTYAIDHLTDAPSEIIEKLQGMIAQLDKKNASPKKLTSQQEKNEVVKTAIVEFLSDNADKGFTCSDLIKAVPELEGDSNQHVSALMRALRLEDKVTNYTDKRKTYFKIKVVEG